MAEIKDGGPAFPTEPRVERIGPYGFQIDTTHPAQAGMSLRDYFAARVLPQLVGRCTNAVAAQLAYEAADAMLRAREGK